MDRKRSLLVTGVGAPGVQGTIYALRSLGMPIVGTDADSEAVGKYLCDAFYTLPLAREGENYLKALLEICQSESVAVIVPQNTSELLLLSEQKPIFEAIGTRIVVSSRESISLANDKYSLLCASRSQGLPTADFVLCDTFASLEAEVLSRREKKEWTVVKPPCGNGSRGVRIIIDSGKEDRKRAFFHQKPSSLHCTLEELHAILGDSFSPLLVMDYLEGDEYTVDVFRSGNCFMALPRKREAMRSGITFRASLEQNELIIESSRRLAEILDLQYCFGFQFKKDKHGVPKLLECNPRVQGTMVMSVFSGANIIAASVKAVLGETIPTMEVDWNTKLIRYWGAIGIHGTEVVKI